jgi:hypothetical protein
MPKRHRRVMLFSYKRNNKPVKLGGPREGKVLMEAEHLKEFIPPSFDLDNYKGTESYTAIDWLCALAERHYRTFEEFSEYKPDDDDIEAIYNEYLTAYQAIIGRGSMYLRDIEINKMLRFIVEQQHELSIETIDESAELLERGPERIYACIDLSTPDEVLIKSFKEWVSFNRWQRNISQHKFYSKGEIFRWHKYKVLPYFDLRRWSEIKGKELTDRIAGEILFEGDGRNKTDLIKKKTKKIYNEVVDWPLVNDLYRGAKVK